jgi:hypothetical protein
MTATHFASAAKLYESGQGGWVSCSQDDYDFAIGAVPPIDMTAGGFIMGEPYDHNDKGEGVYAVFRTVWANGKKTGHELRMMTAAEGRNMLGIVR